jgi:hypothetical protein
LRQKVIIVLYHKYVEKQIGSEKQPVCDFQVLQNKDIIAVTPRGIGHPSLTILFHFFAQC